MYKFVLEYRESGIYFGWFGFNYYEVLSSTDPDMMFQRESQSDTLPLIKGVPAVIAKNIGLKTFN